RGRKAMARGRKCDGARSKGDGARLVFARGIPGVHNAGRGGDPSFREEALISRETLEPSERVESPGGNGSTLKNGRAGSSPSPTEFRRALLEHGARSSSARPAARRARAH